MKTIQTLENILAQLEDCLWLVNTVNQMQGKKATFPESGALRAAMLNNSLEQARAFTNHLYHLYRSSFGSEHRYEYDTALDLQSWFFGSKRVFTVSKTLMDMLLSTNLPDFPANEIRFVAPCFVVHLEEPFQISNGNYFDTLVVRTGEERGRPVVSIRGYQNTFAGYSAKSEAQKKVVERDIRSGDFRSLNKMMKGAATRNALGYTVQIGTGTIPESIKSMDTGEHPLEDFLTLYHIGIGLNLYLQTARLPEDTERITTFRHPKVLPKDTRKPFTNNTQLFSLGTSKAFSRHTPSEGDESESSGGVRPHFRRGFWRRPNGLGNDPTALATIWVRPTWVHQDKIDAGERPIGSNQSVQTVS